MLNETKYEEAEELLKKLYAKMDEGTLYPSEEGMWEVLTWLLDGMDKPEID